jgi:hemolysin III
MSEPAYRRETVAERIRMRKFSLPHLETPAEEVVSSITHGVGFVFSLVALLVLVIIASMGGDSRRIVTVSIYGGTLLLMYAASTCYHFVRSPQAKRALRIFDHASIYLLIAGTYTPFVLVSMGGGWGWSLFGVIWGMAVAGVLFKLFYVEYYETVSLILYVMMAWLALVAVKPLLADVPFGGLVLLAGGGAAYMAGIIFYLWDHLPFNHAIWHLFVIAGSVCHFIAVLVYVLPITTN